jgi:hypothetical protein
VEEVLKTILADSQLIVQSQVRWAPTLKVSDIAAEIFEEALKDMKVQSYDK